MGFSAAFRIPSSRTLGLILSTMIFLQSRAYIYLRPRGPAGCPPENEFGDLGERRAVPLRIGIVDPLDDPIGDRVELPNRTLVAECSDFPLDVLFIATRHFPLLPINRDLWQSNGF